LVAGRFWTIVAGSVIYQLGMVSLTVSALLPSLHPPPCSTDHDSCARASTSALVVLHLSLFCTSIGTGGTRPCVMAAFGADQFELHGPCHGEKKRRWSFFNLYFFAVELAKLAAITLVVYVQENVGWEWGLGVPIVAMLVAVTAFMWGNPLYVNMAPGGSPCTRLAQVLDAAISTAGRLLHTNQLR
jgi:dipeptide/tripeptide permease